MDSFDLNLFGFHWSLGHGEHDIHWLVFISCLYLCSRGCWRCPFSLDISINPSFPFYLLVNLVQEDPDSRSGRSHDLILLGAKKISVPHEIKRRGKERKKWEKTGDKLSFPLTITLFQSSFLSSNNCDLFTFHPRNIGPTA
jgi:hypothetical protein